MKCQIEGCNVVREDLSQHIRLDHKMPVQEYKIKFNVKYVIDEEKRLKRGASRRKSNQIIKQFECKVCGEKCLTEKALMKHYTNSKDAQHSYIIFNDTNKETWVQCEICGLRRSRLDFHLTADHNISKEAYEKLYKKTCFSEDYLKKNKANSIKNQIHIKKEIKHKKEIKLKTVSIVEDIGDFKRKSQEEKFIEKKEFVDFVRCKCKLENGKICSWPAKRISSHILKFHNMTTTQYKEKFDSPVVCLLTCKKTSFKGKHSEETRRKMSKARKGLLPWNTGLTKDENMSLKSISDKAKIRLSIKENNNWSTNPLSGERSGMFGKPSWRKGLSSETSELIEAAEEKSCGIQHHKSNYGKNEVYNMNKFVADFAMQQMQKIKETDKKCVMCGEVDKLQVHHIIPRNCFDAYDLRSHSSINLITLCNKQHSSYGQSVDKAIIKTNSEEEMKEQFYEEYKIYKEWITYTQNRFVSCLPIEKKVVEQLDEKMRLSLAETIFEELRTIGFPYSNYTEEILLKDLVNVENSTSTIRLENSILRNYNTSGSKIREHFIREQYRHFIDVFNDDQQLFKVIKNRLGLEWKTTPEFFNMNYKIIIKGFEVLYPNKRFSKYKASTAKWIIEKFCKGDTVFDYSSGWGDRMLGAVAAKKNYLGIDTNSSLISELNNSATWLMKNRNVKINLLNIDSSTYNGRIEFAYSCPPYGVQEEYKDSKYISDKMWLQSFMIPVIKMCDSNLISNGIFVCHLPTRFIPFVKIELEKFFKYITSISIPNRHDAYHDGNERINEVILVYQKNNELI